MVLVTSRDHYFRWGRLMCVCVMLQWVSSPKIGNNDQVEDSLECYVFNKTLILSYFLDLLLIKAEVTKVVVKQGR